MNSIVRFAMRGAQRLGGNADMVAGKSECPGGKAKMRGLGIDVHPPEPEHADGAPSIPVAVVGDRMASGRYIAMLVKPFDRLGAL